MNVQSAEELLPDGAVARLAETVAQAWALYNRLLSVALVISCGMFIGREAAARAVAGGLELGLASAAKTIYVLSHAERVHDLAAAVEDAVLASSDPPTRKELAVVYMRASRLASACADAYEILLEREEE